MNPGISQDADNSSQQGYESELSEKSRNYDSGTPPAIYSDVLNDYTEIENPDTIHELARQITNASVSSRHEYLDTTNGQPINPFTDSSNPALDPLSGHFQPKEWLRHMINIRSRDPDRPPPLTTGVAFQDLGAYGYGSSADFQKTVGNIALKGFDLAKTVSGLKHQNRIQILRHFDGLLKCGEICIVLGRPGSGCTTFLKSIAGNTHGFHYDNETYLNYEGVTPEDIGKHFRGDFIYNAETDINFPHLTVGQTLKFAALARTPTNRVFGVSRDQYATHLRDVVMASFGLTHTLNTKVGNDFVRGVSGGERKRVSLAEATLNGSALQCWDNSTRGLDAATALEFIKNLRISAKIGGSTSLVSLYQASQDAYDQFDKVTVLYEGRQIYFGPTTKAKKFFEDMGWQCPPRQTTGDFLTSLTNPTERVCKPGFEDRVPRTPDEFEKRWRDSSEHAQLMQEIAEFNQQFPLGGDGLQRFQEARNSKQAKHVRNRSPYTINYRMQINLCVMRGFQRLFGDLSMAFTTIFGQCAMALITSSLFYNMKPDTSSFYQRGALLFFAVLMNAFSSALEILSLYEQRPIVEKHTRYALYHPSAEAIASILCDLPTKILTAIPFNLIIYFMTNLKREPGAFFIFLLITFVTTLTMSHIFRTIGACSRTISEALTPASIMILIFVIYTGFVIPVPYMHGWIKWVRWLNPIFYSYSAILANEFRGRSFRCAQTVPATGNYDGLPMVNRACVITGYSAPLGAEYIEGADYTTKAFGYRPDEIWRNFGILLAFGIFFGCTYLIATELVQAAKSKGEILVFRRGHMPSPKADEETQSLEQSAGRKTMGSDSDDTMAVNIQAQKGIFQWTDVCYDINIKGETRRILDHVDGWVKPGTLTALMGASGAGKTTLLDVLASRVTMGVVTGDMLVNGKQRNTSFQRKTGYVQQQDLHLETSTVREALEFSALLRQPNSVPDAEKLAYVDEVIKILEMEDYSEAVVGVPGEGLNVEQRKRLTIGVELAAKPELLLFLDEPTSGLDSQTSWSICLLMKKLANSGQAILCTIHQPSAMLFQQFDRLLFLQKGGQTVYFGDIGHNSETLINYFVRNGADPCPPEANPAEWMLSVVGAAPGSEAVRDWFECWTQSPERSALRRELKEMAMDLASKEDGGDSDPEMMRTFAAPFSKQLKLVIVRVWQQYWRTPQYIWSKLALCTLSPMFIGFSFFKASNDQQGLQNQMFAIFNALVSFGTICQQLMPHFVKQRSLYEVRERPSKAYSWQAFMVSNLLVEMPWQTLAAILQFFVYYYPIGFYRNAVWTDKVNERGALFFLLFWQFYIFTSTFAHMMIAGIETAETASNIANLMFSLTLLMCGVLATPDNMPRFWIFMYRVSPFTYLVSALLITGVSSAPVICNSRELLKFEPAQGMDCGTYMAPYIEKAGGYLSNKNATDMCHYCTMDNTNAFLQAIDIKSDNLMRKAWANYGIFNAYIVFNIFAALAMYWLFRVPKKSNIVKDSQTESGQQPAVTEAHNKE